LGVRKPGIFREAGISGVIARVAESSLKDSSLLAALSKIREAMLFSSCRPGGAIAAPIDG